MSDDKSKRGPRDSSRINVNEDYELRYWTKTLNVSKDVLIHTVKKVGPMVDNVRSALKK